MNTEQLFLQLGIAGAVLLVAYRVFVLLINRWGVADAKRTEALTEGLTSISQKLDAHATADAQSHKDMTDRISRFEGRIEGVLDAADRVAGVLRPDASGAEAVTERARQPTDLGELNIRHLNRELGLVRAESSETHRLVREQVIPALSAIADRLGILEAVPLPAPPLSPTAPSTIADGRQPPRIPWRLFATAVAAAITAAGLVLAGIHILYGA